jgi:hypothetical protein
VRSDALVENNLRRDRPDPNALTYTTPSPTLRKLDLGDTIARATVAPPRARGSGNDRRYRSIANTPAAYQTCYVGSRNIRASPCTMRRRRRASKTVARRASFSREPRHVIRALRYMKAYFAKPPVGHKKNQLEPKVQTAFHANLLD